MAEKPDEEETESKTRNQILNLQSEYARKKEWLGRLKEKEKALKDEQQARAEEKDNIVLKINLENKEKNDHRENRSSNNAEDEAVKQYIARETKSMLKDRIPAFNEDVGEEDSDDDENLDAEEQQDDTKQNHDSVIITYMNTDPVERERLNEYRVSYRIDRSIRVVDLHADVCEYWGCSRDEFALCEQPQDKSSTVLKELDDPDKQVIQNYLPRNKRAHLILAHKDVVKDRNLMSKSQGIDLEKLFAKAQSTEVDDAALASMKHGGKAQEEKDQDHFAQAFSKWPGVYTLLKGKQKPQFKKWTQIKCRSITCYVFLALFTGLAILFRNQANHYWLREGILQTLAEGIPGESSQPIPAGAENIANVRSVEQIWHWVNGPFHYQLFNNASTLRKFYVPEGFLRVRQQKAKKLKNCRRKDATPQSCYSVSVYSEDDQDKAFLYPSSMISSLKIDGHFNAGIDNYTKPDPMPDVWQKSKDYSADLSGFVQSKYDGSGYMLDYQLSNTTNEARAASTFSADMAVARSVWVNQQTRLLTFELLLANYNLGGFVSSTFMFEITPSGSVQPSAILMPIDIGDATDGGSVQLMLTVLRFLIIFYILTVQVYTETNLKVAAGTSGLMYVFSIIGFLDMSTVSLFCAIGYMRLGFDPPKPFGMTKFYSYSQEGMEYEQTFITEGVFLILIMLRLCALMRLNPHVNQYYKMFGRGLFMFGFFAIIFFPIFFGLIMFAHCIWGSGVLQFSTFWETLCSLVSFIKQDFNVRLLLEKNETWTVVYIIFYTLTVTIFLINGFLAITVHSYFQVQIADGLPKERKSWTKDQWMDWLLFGPLYKKITGKKPGSSKREDGEGDEEGGEESSSDDEGDDKED
jgi:hypothetical protein